MGVASRNFRIKGVAASRFMGDVERALSVGLCQFVFYIETTRRMALQK